MKPRFSDEQIIQMIKGQEAGERTADVCRRYGINQGTFCKYKSKYGGMEPSDAKRLRQLEDENARLKKLVAEQMLGITMLRDVNSKKFDARCQAAGRGAPSGSRQSQRGPGVCHLEHRPERPHASGPI